METEGIGGLLVETHNGNKTIAFWQGLGFELKFETDHLSPFPPCPFERRHPAASSFGAKRFFRVFPSASSGFFGGIDLGSTIERTGALKP